MEACNYYEYPISISIFDTLFPNIQRRNLLRKPPTGMCSIKGVWLSVVYCIAGNSYIMVEFSYNYSISIRKLTFPCNMLYVTMLSCTNIKWVTKICTNKNYPLYGIYFTTHHTCRHGSHDSLSEDEEEFDFEKSPL